MKEHKLKQGDHVVMHTCMEHDHPDNFGKIWTCKTDSFRHKGHEYDSIFLEGFSGSFSTEFLQKVNIEDLRAEKDATIKELEQQVKKWKSLAESKVTHVHYNDNELLRKALKFAGWDIKQKMETKTIKTPSWVLLEALGHVDCELVDIDLEGGMVKITTVKGDKQ